MRALTLQDVATAVGGRVLGEIVTPGVTSVSTDSRTVEQGSVFIALKGPNHDGHAFVEKALKKGATAAVIADHTKIDAQYHACGRLILVPDTLEALGRLAAWYRRQFAAQVIAVVGSNGKTTTKDLIATVLSSKMPGKAAEASFNNAIGVPLTLLAVEPADAYVVTEIGTNHPGEIAALGRIAQPDMVIVTSIGEEHMEHLGDLTSIAKEEFSIISCMGGRAFIALSDQAAHFAPNGVLKERTKIIFGLDGNADLRATDIVSTKNGQAFKVNDRFEYSLPLLGEHNVVNALAAIAIGTRFRLTHEEIAKALKDAKHPPMRTQRVSLNGLTVINDAYNANPSSMRVAFDVMDRLPDIGRRVFILGDMRELGTQAAKGHQAIGRAAGQSTAHVIIAVGDSARIVVDGATTAAGTTKRLYAFQTIEALEERLASLIEPGDVVLLKASRGVGLERLLGQLKKIASERLTS